jgi:hypothetical protein
MEIALTLRRHTLQFSLVLLTGVVIMAGLVVFELSKTEVTTMTLFAAAGIAAFAIAITIVPNTVCMFETQKKYVNSTFVEQ